ncbi:hypothetical protein SeLEV6574_g02798 [Synchytrium endobioticum]|nr:hypothetical protein SeLEV6574_g02798 [Synchytrium endobioticum]
MSTSTYHVEYAKTARAKCNGPNDCPYAHKFDKNQLKLVNSFERNGMHMNKGRHWCCVTPTILKHMKDAAPVGGLDDLEEADRKRVEECIETGQLDAESLKQRPPKEKTPRKRKSKKNGDGDGDGDEDDAGQGDTVAADSDDEDDQGKPKKKPKTAAPKKKTPPKKGKGKKNTKEEQEEEEKEELDEEELDIDEVDG